MRSAPLLVSDSTELWFLDLDQYGVHELMSKQQILIDERVREMLLRSETFEAVLWYPEPKADSGTTMRPKG
jgi:hypothetical protein